LVNTGDRYIDGADRNIDIRLLPGFSIIEETEAGKTIEKGKGGLETRVWLLFLACDG
jgi:hypothetical protein